MERKGVDQDVIDIEGFRSYLYEEELSNNSIATYIRGVQRFAELFDEVTKPNLLEFKQFLMSNFKPQTVNLRLTAMMRYCKYKGIHETIKLVKEPKETHIDNVITEDQYNRLIDGLRLDGNYRWYYHVILLAKTGMRISEALRVTKKDILSGSVTMHTKGHMRTIYFPKSLIEEMREYLEQFNDQDTIMINHNGKAITSRGVSGEFKKFADRYGIPRENVHPHAFRHFFAIEFLKRNNNISLLADVLGHGSVKITQIYLRQSQEQQRKAVDDAVDW